MNNILYYSTNLKADKVPFNKALLQGLAPDGGLYMPTAIPTITKDELQGLSSLEYHEIAAMILSKFLSEEIAADDLLKLTEDAYDFKVPIEHIYDSTYVMRLDRGPTASFKDFAARMMARLMQYYLKKEKRKLVILTATSGDTGSAIANAYYGLDGIDVVVLFPIGEVTTRQRKQMTTLGKNVKVMTVDGKFDDCQALVKKAFMDRDLRKLNLTSANSINIGRLLPQTVYYFYAYSQVCKEGEKIIFTVPSGNFGDLMGGIIAQKMGLPVEKFICATNANDEFPNFLETGKYKKIEPSKNCISSAMNVGHPSNLSRLVEIYKGNMDEKGTVLKEPDFDAMRKELHAVSITDEQTRETIKSAYEKHNLLLEPHGAVGWAAWEEYSTGNDCNEIPSVILETAHPAKFPEEIVNILGFEPDLPPSLFGIEGREEKIVSFGKNYDDFVIYLTDNF